jgi:S1-C subfamily serine protease
VPTLRQTATFLLRWTIVGLAGAGVLLLIRPGLLGNVTTAASSATSTPVANIGEPRRSFADAVKRAGPAVVNIYTARVVDATARPSGRNPLLQQHLPAVRQRVE